MIERARIWSVGLLSLAALVACEDLAEGQHPAPEPDAPPAEEPAEPAEPEDPPPEAPGCTEFPPPAIAQADVVPIEPLDAIAPDCAALRGEAMPRRLGPHPPSLPLEGVCGAGGYRPSNYTRAAGAAIAGRPYELHVIGVYEGELPPTSPAVEAAVDVEIRATARPVVLVLSAYSAVQWNLLPSADARIAGVITAGHDAQIVSGSPVPVQAFDHERFCATGHGWEVRANLGGADHRVMISAIRDAFGHAESSYQGCYAGQRFVVPYSTCAQTLAPPIPAVDEAIARRDVELEPCDAIRDDSIYCLSVGAGGLEAIGIDSGARCVLDPDFTPSPHASSMAWSGEALYLCDDRGLVRYDLATGAVVVPEVTCEAATADGGDLLVAPPITLGPQRTLFRYADGAGLIDGDIIQRVGHRLWASRFVAEGDVLYGAWHSTDHIERHDLATGAPLPALALEGFDGRVEGFDVVGDTAIVQQSDALLLFGAADGRSRGRIPLGGFGLRSALACVGPAEAR